MHHHCNAHHNIHCLLSGSNCDDDTIVVSAGPIQMPTVDSSRLFPTSYNGRSGNAIFQFAVLIQLFLTETEKNVFSRFHMTCSTPPPTRAGMPGLPKL